MGNKDDSEGGGLGTGTQSIAQRSLDDAQYNNIERLGTRLSTVKFCDGDHTL